MAVTIYGVCALTFMMGMYALEGRGRIFVLAFALGCALSSSYGFCPERGPSAWSKGSGPSSHSGATSWPAVRVMPPRDGTGPARRGYSFCARTACAAARRATGTRKGEQLT
jgi:hypothetical protein